MKQPDILKHVNPYLYTQDKPWDYRLIGFIGFISTLLAGVGYINFLNLSPWYWLIFGPIALLLFYNHSLANLIRILYPNFSKNDHLKFVTNYWENNEQPKVAVFLPWCGESLEVFEQTIIGVINLIYSNKTVYVLDDKGDEKAKALAHKYGLNYLSRPNKGEYKKSGNLQYGWDNSNGEKYAFVLDADFVPTEDALLHTIPYIDTDPKIGILQTPQYFEQTKEKHDISPIAFGGGNIVEEFYSLDQVCRDRFGAAICVGTSALYRRTTIESVGGTPKVWGTEDVRTGLLITRTGYKVKYIPLIVSIGTSPDTLQDYFRQHSRWCAGSLQILSDYYAKAKMGVMGRLIYLMNPIYYITEALAPILVFHFIALLAFQPNTIALYNSLLFLPKLLFELVLMPHVFRRHKQMNGSKLAALNNIFTYFYTIFFDMIKKTKMAWHPAGVALGGISAQYRSAMRLGIILTSTYVIGLTVVLMIRREFLTNIQVSVVLFWSLYVAFWYVRYIYSVTKFMKSHDVNYTHPTSLFITKLRRNWAHVKHAILPVLTFGLFISVFVNFVQLIAIKYNLSGHFVTFGNTSLLVLESLRNPQGALITASISALLLLTIAWNSLVDQIDEYR
jgi:cellulose synthase (UDP-forming)